MATVIETVEREGRTIAVYDNGMERDMERGHIVKPPPHTLITKQNSTELHRARQEKKRQRAQAGANAALAAQLDDQGLPAWVNPQDLDFVEALTEAQMKLAMEGNAYSTRAAEFVMSATGMDEKVVKDEPAAAGAADLVHAVAELLGKMQELIHAPQDGVIDGQVLRSDILTSNNLRIGETSEVSPTEESEDE